jgi:hypothetical protein
MLRDFTRLLFALINFGDAPLWIAPEDSIMLEQSRLEELDLDARGWRPIRIIILITSNKIESYSHLHYPSD